MTRSTAADSESTNGGNVSSGALINVIIVPFTLSPANYSGSNVNLLSTDLGSLAGAAASMRVIKFAEMASFYSFL
ncbi:hypothetical protein [Bacillus sp. AFS033286]|uniref:hypothetical protein n=1 Tax=Bacillus sp. AFS033286 TaxID=2033498 RepID=UPI00114525F1|nr:hypothetical protein [Bacillus sp. AFS033286]